MTIHTASAKSVSDVQTQKRLLPALAAALLGLVILFGAMLAPQPAVHNAAHDTRHSFASPCH